MNSLGTEDGSIENSSNVFIRKINIGGTDGLVLMIIHGTCINIFLEEVLINKDTNKLIYKPVGDVGFALVVGP